MDKELLVGIFGVLSFMTLFACSGVYFLDRELGILMVGIISFIIWVLMMVIDNNIKEKNVIMNKMGTVALLCGLFDRCVSGVFHIHKN